MRQKLCCDVDRLLHFLGHATRAQNENYTAVDRLQSSADARQNVIYKDIIDPLSGGVNATVNRFSALSKIRY